MLASTEFTELWVEDRAQTTYRMDFSNRRRRRRGGRADRRDAEIEQVKFRITEGVVPDGCRRSMPARAKPTVARSRLTALVGSPTSSASCVVDCRSRRATIVRILKRVRSPRRGQGEPGGVHRPGRRGDQQGALRRRPPTASCTRQTGEAWAAELVQGTPPGRDRRAPGRSGEEEHHRQGRVRLGGRGDLRRVPRRPR